MYILITIRVPAKKIRKGAMNFCPNFLKFARIMIFRVKTKKKKKKKKERKKFVSDF